jgi:hypothetical protein
MASCSISYFLLLRQNKVTKEKATPVYRRFAPRLVRLPHKLARFAACVVGALAPYNHGVLLKGTTQPSALTYSSEFPDQPVLVGGAQGMKSKSQNSKLMLR